MQDKRVEPQVRKPRAPRTQKHDPVASPPTSSERTSTGMPRDVAERLARRTLNHTPESVKAHFEAHPPEPGDTLILAELQGGVSIYRLVKVAGVKAVGGPRRIVIDTSPSWGGDDFYWSGKNVRHPTGQTYLLPLVPAVADRLSPGRRTMLSDTDLEQLLNP